MSSTKAYLNDQHILGVPSEYVEEFTSQLHGVSNVAEFMAIDQHCVHVDRLFLAHAVHLLYKAQIDLRSELILESFVSALLLAHEIREIYSGELRQQLLLLSNASESGVLQWRVELLRRCRFHISVDVEILEQIACFGGDDAMWYRRRDLAAMRQLKARSSN